MNVQSVRDLKLQIALELFTPHLNDLIQRSTLPTLDHLQFPILPMRIGIGIGIGQRPGEFSLAIRVRERIPPLDQILQRLIAMANNEVDIVETGQVRLFAPAIDPQTLRARCRPLVIGCSVAHVTATAGTLGFMAKHNKTNRTVLVSNSHVFAHSGSAKVGDGITQPGRVDGAAEPVGALLDYVPLKLDGSNQVDAAIAVPDPAVALQPDAIPGIGNFTLVAGGDVLPNMNVTKVGRTSGLTRGVVTAVEFDHVLVDTEIGGATFDGQIEIRGTEHAFSQLGDSGSLVVTDQNQAIGMVFCGNEFANNGLGVTYANPLPKVMDALNLSPL
jgi:hypothetical protein